MIDESISTVVFENKFVQHLAKIGIELPPHGAYPVHSHTLLEPPLSLNGINIWASPAQIGAFTYFGPGEFYDASIGRYCSVGSGLSVGLGQHPVSHLTSSPIPYLSLLNFEQFIADQQPGWRRKLPPSFTFPLRSKTTIGNDVWIGSGVFIRDGLTIGDGAIIGAHSVVTHDIGPYQIVAGNPARVIRNRFSDILIERLLDVKWWRFNIYDIDFDTKDVPGSISRIEDRFLSSELNFYAPNIINLSSEYESYSKLSMP